MTTDPDAVPRQRVPLRPVPGTEDGTGGSPVPVPDPSTDSGTGDGTAVLPAVSTPVPLSAARRAGTALQYHARGLWLDPGRLLHSLYHGRPRSMAMHITGTKSLGWVPPEMTGKPRTFLAWSGIAYRLTIGLLLKNLGNGISAAGDSFFVAFALTALVVVLIVLL